MAHDTYSDTGSGIDLILLDSPDGALLFERPWGSGVIIYGGLTYECYSGCGACGVGDAGTVVVNEISWGSSFCQGESCAIGCSDVDADTVCDSQDLCPGSDDFTAPDADGDGVCDTFDVCAGFDDLDDVDGDGQPAACDPCPLDLFDDSDGDGSCDSVDLCLGFDDAVDGDGDGVPNGCDLCPVDLFPNDDDDGDTVCNSYDLCPGSNDLADIDGDGLPDDCDPCIFDPDGFDDADGDTVCNAFDQCPGFNDFIDVDGDNAPDACDPCPYDSPDDLDNDGVCDLDDLCPGEDDQQDGDGDGVPDACDPCPIDNPDSGDGDDVCDSVDLCPDFDDAIDNDGDGVPDLCDPCPVDNPDDSDQDGVCDFADRCPGFPETDADGNGYPDACDGCFAGALDSDGDGVCDVNDVCDGFSDLNDSDGDGQPNACDPCPSFNPDDTDGDGLCDGVDQCPGFADFIDSDGDGVPDGCDPCPNHPFEDDLDGDGFIACEDCDDSDFMISPSEEELPADGLDQNCDGVDACYRDIDGDGSGTWAVIDGFDISCTGPGESLDSADCNDGDSAINLSADEVCDGVDNNCDGTIDEDDAVNAISWCRDSDGDGFGDIASQHVACSPPPGFVGNCTDCDDGDTAINPAALEVCDGLDNDCSGAADGVEAVDAEPYYADADGDGFGDPGDASLACEPIAPYLTQDASDCDDGDAAVNPGMIEICGGGDEDCNGLDGDDDPMVDPSSLVTYFADADLDGYGDSGDSETRCDPSPGFVPDGGDCDDGDPDINPGAEEIPGDGIDQDCDSSDGVDPGVDTDGDGLLDIDEFELGTDPENSDSDADGIDDLTEVGEVENPLDSDGDGIIDALDEDDDGDGIPTVVEGAEDFDGDSIPNYLDLDSDGDGVFDAAEGEEGLLDAGSDGGSEDETPPAKPGQYGCGCATSGAPLQGWGVLCLLGLAALRRRSSAA